MESVVLWEKEDGVGLVTLHRPQKLNALTRQVFTELEKILAGAEDDKEVKTIILTGAGKAFCAGGDIAELPAFEVDDPLLRERDIEAANRMTLLLYRMPKPVIAAVNGLAAGAGLSIAMACDIRMASEEARFIETFVRGGLIPDMGGTYLLPRLVGLGKAFEMIYTGDMIDAHEALRIGLVNQVLPVSELMVQSTALARRLAHGSAQSYRFSKWAVHQGLESDLGAALEHEGLIQNLLLSTEEVRSAAQAFIEKKKRFGEEPERRQG
jgi:2-(1,2-epoxy-1,2-dihydrophenyl)acetyl-CoA isomerase